jgi:hypothetical protein
MRFGIAGSKASASGELLEKNTVGLAQEANAAGFERLHQLLPKSFAAAS